MNNAGGGTDAGENSPSYKNKELPSESPNQRAAHIAMVVFALLISTSFTVGAAITDALDPVALTFLRFLLAAVIFVGLLTVTESWRMPRPFDLLRYGAIALLLVIYFVTMFEALRWSAPVSLSAVFTLVPLMTAFISLYLLKQGIGRGLAIGLIIAALGALWVVFEGSMQNLLDFSIEKGEAIFFVVCIAYSVCSPVVRKLHRGESILTLTF